jgi:hypothetical protein
VAFSEYVNFKNKYVWSTKASSRFAWLRSAYDKYLSMAIEYKLDLSRQYFVNQVLINACHLRNPDLSYMRNDINSLCYTFIFCFTYNLSIQSHSDRWVYRVFFLSICACWLKCSMLRRKKFWNGEALVEE